VLPGVPAVACFDTAFHATMPPAATTYALPRRWRERFQLRRYGFHGLSHAYASRRAREMLAPRSSARLVTCHLGAGASLAAVRDGASVDTTMGFTPLEGLVMATRCGSVDPGMLLWLLERRSIETAELADALEHDSGLLGLAGTGDMRELLARSDEQAALALEVYLHRLRAGIAAMTASLGGIDALVFTGGVGQHSESIRACAAKAWATSVSRWILGATATPQETPRWPSTAPRSRCSWWPRVRISRSPGRPDKSFPDAAVSRLRPVSRRGRRWRLHLPGRLKTLHRDSLS
jgi:acetate kinase